jgi:hypothetical protein
MIENGNINQRGDTVKTKDIKIGDRVQVKNSISGRIMEITPNGWVKLAWWFGGCTTTHQKPSMMVGGFRAKDIECIL